MPNTTLDMIKEGQTCVIVKISGESRFRKRLIEMGFLPKVEIFVKKFAPLKDPGEYVINNFHISLRKSEASSIIVENIKGEHEIERG